jgi:hypothetical protein
MKEPNYRTKCPICKIHLVVPSWLTCQSRSCEKEWTLKNKKKIRKKRKKSKRLKLTYTLKKKILILHKEGLTVIEMAKKISTKKKIIHPPSVKFFLKRHNERLQRTIKKI